MKIVNENGGDPCLVIPLGRSRRYAAPNANWRATEGLAVKRVDKETIEVTGTAVSQGIGDQKLTASDQNSSLSLKITVVDLRAITATVWPTPPVGDGPQLYRKLMANPPARDPINFISTVDSVEFGEEFDPTEVLVLLRGAFPDVPVEPTVTPEDFPLDWSVARIGRKLPEHHGPNLPTLTGTAANKQLKTDATGAFVVRARPQCNCGPGHDDASVALRLVLVHAELSADRTAMNVDAFAKKSETAPFSYNQEPYGETEVGSNEGTRVIAFDADIKLISGGDDGRLYVRDAIRAGWCNNIRNEDAELTASYTGGKIVYSAYITKAMEANVLGFMAADSEYTQIIGPVWDGQEPINEAREIMPSHGVGTIHDAVGGNGSIVTITIEDNPNKNAPLEHPGGGEQMMTGFRIDHQFVAAAFVRTKSAPWVIGVAYKLPWHTLLEYDVQSKQDRKNGGWKAEQKARIAALGDPKVYQSLKAADRAGVQVWEPGGADHFVVIFG